MSVCATCGLPILFDVHDGVWRHQQGPTGQTEHPVAPQKKVA